MEKFTKLAVNRRSFLGGIAAVSFPSAAAVAIAADETAVATIDQFLMLATPAERARYHMNALTEVMAEMHPDRSWRSEICHKNHFVLTVGDSKIRRSARVAKVHIDDGPLLADDVTGTTAFADWEAGR